MSKSSELYQAECITIHPRDLKRKTKEELNEFLYWLYDSFPGIPFYMEDKVLNSGEVHYDDVDRVSEKAQEWFIEDPYTYMDLIFNPKEANK